MPWWVPAPHAGAAGPGHTMAKVPRIPLLAGSRVQLVTVDDDAVLLAPPPPLEPLADVGAAVAEALRYPLSGASLGQLVTPGGRVTIVVEPSLLPLPGAPADPRQDALAAVIDELARLGMRGERHTVLVAGGLERRSGRTEREAVLRPARAHSFRGVVAVHDCTDDALRELLDGGGVATGMRINPHLLDTDLVVVVTAAETADRGGAAALLGACDADTIASPPPGPSLLEPSASPARALGATIEKAVTAHVPVIGASLVLDHPRLAGRYRGYPSSNDTVRDATRSPFRPLLNAMPGGVRRLLLQRMGRELHATAVLAGPPSVAHTEALLRGIALRGRRLDEPVDSIVVPLPWKAPHQPRESLNPITVTATGLGIALRLWRDASPLREGGTIVLLHDFHRTFGSGPQEPYRALFHALRDERDPGLVATARAAAREDPRALASYRSGRAPHPLLPFSDWDSCGPVLARAGRVIVAGCRDAAAARALGFVPSHNAATALEMARGVAGGTHRLGVLLAPPYAPLLVGGAGA